TIVFVEVKTRTSDRYTDPEYAVDAGKRRRLKKIARYYLARRESEGYNVRFDIVSAVIVEGQKPQLRHIEDAFR
ncbi:MAG: YraN family protein, partial [Planctomycetes bacterium]|nr:YraN family protein [Planctomycetota bacterium]